jgi:hypothetical protein
MAGKLARSIVPRKKVICFKRNNLLTLSLQLLIKLHLDGHFEMTIGSYLNIGRLAV